MEHFDEQMEATKLLAQRNRSHEPIEYGYICSYNDKAGSVTVYYPHDLAAGAKVARGPFQLFSPYIGSPGFGMLGAPVGGGLDGNGNPTGEPCTVFYPDPEGELGICLMGHYNGKWTAPGVPAGEWWVTHKDGSTLKIRKGGKASFTGATIELGDEGASSNPDNAILRLADLKAYHNNYIALHTHGTPFGPSTSPLLSFIGWVASLKVFSK